MFVWYEDLLFLQHPVIASSEFVHFVDFDPGLGLPTCFLLLISIKEEWKIK